MDHHTRKDLERIRRKLDTVQHISSLDVTKHVGGTVELTVRYTPIPSLDPGRVKQALDQTHEDQRARLESLAANATASARLGSHHLARAQEALAPQSMRSDINPPRHYGRY